MFISLQEQDSSQPIFPEVMIYCDLEEFAFIVSSMRYWRKRFASPSEDDKELTVEKAAKAVDFISQFMTRVDEISPALDEQLKIYADSLEHPIELIPES